MIILFFEIKSYDDIWGIVFCYCKLDLGRLDLCIVLVNIWNDKVIFIVFKWLKVIEFSYVIN